MNDRPVCESCTHSHMSLTGEMVCYCPIPAAVIVAIQYHGSSDLFERVCKMRHLPVEDCMENVCECYANE